MEVETLTVTPGQAAEWLLGNVNNRNVRERIVRQYAADMSAGKWRFNGDAIRFNGDGNLIDGQHRLLACVESGTPFETLIVRGLSDDDKVTLDAGVKRNFADTLKFAGEGYPLEMAATARACWLYENFPNPARTTYPPSHSQMNIWLEENRNAARAACDCARAIRRVITMPVAAISVPYLYGFRAAPEDTADFFEKLRTGIDIQDGTAVLALRRYLELLRARRSKPPTPVTTAYVIKALNLYRAGAHVEQLMWRGGGRAAEPYPRIASAEDVALGIAS